MNLSTRFVRLVIGVGLCVGASTAHAQLLGPSPYSSFISDSPFSGLTFPEYFHLETFEDGALNTPGVTSTGTVVGPSTLTDSVDADDGAIDGSGTGGRSYFTGQVQTLLGFNFSEATLGGLPTHVGIVWTDVGAVLGGAFGFGPVTFNVYGPGGALLDTTTAANLGDGAIIGATAEDRFFGYISEGGISRIEVFMQLSQDFEVDHLQYGRVPAPGAAALLLIGALTPLRRRRD